jgi:hypothetical protein
MSCLIGGLHGLTAKNSTTSGCHYTEITAHYLSPIMGLLRARPSATAVAQKQRGPGGDPRRANDTETA